MHLCTVLLAQYLKMGLMASLRQESQSSTVTVINKEY